VEFVSKAVHSMLFPLVIKQALSLLIKINVKIAGDVLQVALMG
jgi:hypothetical protein